MKGTWIHSSRAAQSIGLSRDEFQALIKRGCIRADLRSSGVGAGTSYWVYVPDAQYCSVSLKAGTKVETLVERGIFPPTLTGYTGGGLVEWARMANRHDLLLDDRIEVPPALSGGVRADDDSVSLRVEQLEKAVAVLLSTLSPSGTGNLIPSEEKDSFLSKLEEVIMQPLCLHYRGALELLSELQGLEAVTLQDLSDWCLQQGQAGRYLVVLEVARIILDYFRSLPSSNLAGSAASRTVSLARDVHRRITETCLGVESLYRAALSRRSGATPFGYCRTDHNVLDILRKRSGICT